MLIDGERVLDLLRERQQSRGGVAEAAFELVGERVIGILYGDGVRMPISKAAGLARHVVALEERVPVGEPVWRAEKGRVVFDVEVVGGG